MTITQNGYWAMGMTPDAAAEADARNLRAFDTMRQNGKHPAKPMPELYGWRTQNIVKRKLTMTEPVKLYPFEYKRIETNSIANIELIEKMVEREGWKVIHTNLFSVLLERKK